MSGCECDSGVVWCEVVKHQQEGDSSPSWTGAILACPSCLPRHDRRTRRGSCRRTAETRRCPRVMPASANGSAPSDPVSTAGDRPWRVNSNNNKTKKKKKMGRRRREDATNQVQDRPAFRSHTTSEPIERASRSTINQKQPNPRHHPGTWTSAAESWPSWSMSSWRKILRILVGEIGWYFFRRARARDAAICSTPPLSACRPGDLGQTKARGATTGGDVRRAHTAATSPSPPPEINRADTRPSIMRTTNHQAPPPEARTS